ncbi:NADPH:quinone reductase [Actinomadura sp. NBRC 104412]|uniref:NADP-dependent oxidoreductase n=1 Tax=Actinomadura sp. NBRC 104412 TaxID=3032203 RepID=UPI0024A0B4BB|nr:NADP-dependent oxidoreductase [Actinomadura sp. NBRC 104412]GLZ08245.1 NADPH:quinone reductase [Actinomadura sp. NBRC 104412]
MRAVTVATPGGTQVLEVRDVPEPVPGPGQVRIRVAAAAVNPVDVATRAGIMADLGLMPAFGSPGARQAVGLGWDVAGTVDAVGADVRGLAPGDTVIGLNDRLDIPSGAYADAIVLDAAAVSQAPRAVDLVHASTLPLNGTTALQALDALDLAPGDTLLVTGAAGAVGGYAVELAVQRGLRVVATAGAADEALVREFGADHFVPKGEHLGDAVQALVPGGADGALDAAVLGISAQQAVRRGGAYVSVRSDVVPLPLRGIRVSNVLVRADATQLGLLSALVDAGRLTTRVADTLPLADAAKAHERFEEGGLRGRLVLIP